jgi:hypothetical protein
MDKVNVYTHNGDLLSHREQQKFVTCRKINEPIKKWATELNKTFSKEEVQMAKNT